MGSHELLIRLWKIKKKTSSLSDIAIWRYLSRNLKYEKIKKTIFPLENANLSKFFLLDKLVSIQG
jgi:hypothetical protein